MQIETVNKILDIYNFPQAQSLKKLEVGFTNEVYAIDDKLILKICQDISNELPFKREAVLYGHFNGKLPVPQNVIYDKTKTLLPKIFVLYPKIEGENLYNVWHTLHDEQRKSLIRQLCKLLRRISETPLGDLPFELELEPVLNWSDFILQKLDKYLGIVVSAKTITRDEASEINSYISKHKAALSQQKIALVYWDAHFDNILVSEDRIVGLLDFERTGLASIDFMLDIVRRMVEQPKKYMSAHAERFAKDEDYQNLLIWYKEFYPELFDFGQLETRLDIYEIAHCLEDLENWPQVQGLKDSIFKIVRK